MATIDEIKRARLKKLKGIESAGFSLFSKIIWIAIFIIILLIPIKNVFAANSDIANCNELFNRKEDTAGWENCVRTECKEILTNNKYEKPSAGLTDAEKCLLILCGENLNFYGDRLDNIGNTHFKTDEEKLCVFNLAVNSGNKSNCVLIEKEEYEYECYKELGISIIEDCDLDPFCLSYLIDVVDSAEDCLAFRDIYNDRTGRFKDYRDYCLDSFIKEKKELYLCDLTSQDYKSYCISYIAKEKGDDELCNLISDEKSKDRAIKKECFYLISLNKKTGLEHCAAIKDSFRSSCYEEFFETNKHSKFWYCFYPFFVGSGSRMTSGVRNRYFSPCFFSLHFPILVILVLFFAVIAILSIIFSIKLFRKNPDSIKNNFKLALSFSIFISSYYFLLMILGFLSPNIILSDFLAAIPLVVSGATHYQLLTVIFSFIANLPILLFIPLLNLSFYWAFQGSSSLGMDILILIILHTVFFFILLNVIGKITKKRPAISKKVLISIIILLSVVAYMWFYRFFIFTIIIFKNL